MPVADPIVSALARISLWLMVGAALLGVTASTRPASAPVAIAAAIVAVVVILARCRSWDRHWTAPALIVGLVWGVMFLTVLRGGPDEFLGPLATGVVLLALVMSPNRPALARDTAWIIGLIGAASLLAAAASPFTDGSTALDFRWPDRMFLGIPRLAGILGNPNMLGPVVAFGVLIAVVNMVPGYWRAGGRFIPPWAIVALFSVSAVALLWTQSRTAMLALLAAIGAIALLMIVRRLPGWVVLVILGPIGVLAPLVAWQRFGASFNGRSVAWQIGVEAFAQRPVLGWGPDAFAKATFWKEFPGTYWQPLHGHNEIVHVAVQSGIMGLMGLAAAAVLVVVAARRTARVPALLCIPALTYLAWLSGTEMPLGVPGVLATFATPLLVGATVIGIATSSEPPALPVRGRHRASRPAGDA